jgi:hypothetical protein
MLPINEGSNMSIMFQPQSFDVIWGCTYQEVKYSVGTANVKIGFIEVTNLQNFATQITLEIISRSWMSKLNPLISMAYNLTVTQTAAKLAGISSATSASGALSTAFGELMVSMGSAYALEKIFTHEKVPLAELWKPQLSQNEGFDFHTTCQKKYVNFGEAKYSSVISSYKNALTQAERFIDDEKHFRDIVHLMHLVDPACMNNLQNKQFGVVAAFSIKGNRVNLVLTNAAKRAMALANKNKATNVYLIGVKR